MDFQSGERSPSCLCDILLASKSYLIFVVLEGARRSRRIFTFTCDFSRSVRTLEFSQCVDFFQKRDFIDKLFFQDLFLVSISVVLVFYFSMLYFFRL